ncbi:MAG: hypothetical protein ABJH63_15635 [Rhizobiaceae bacterium]
MRTVLLVSAMFGFLLGGASAQESAPLIKAAAGPVVSQAAPRQAQVLADILKDRDITGVAVTYISDDYGKRLETAFAEAFKAHGGRVAISISHRGNEEDYFAEVGALAVAGVEHLVVLGYLEQGGLGIVQTALDTGAFEKFVLGEGMIGKELMKTVGSQLDGSVGALRETAAVGVGVDETKPEVTSKDAKILPGALSSVVDIVNADDTLKLSSKELLPIIPIGEVTDAYHELEVRDGKFETVKIR